MEKRKSMQEKDEKEFSFINEKIKDKPINKKRLVMHTCFVVLMAVLFGVIASFLFALLQPRFQELLYPEQEPVVTIPKDDIVDTETEDTTEAEDTEAVTAPTQEIQQELEIADFQQLQNKLYDVGRIANRSVVTVTGVKSDTDWFNNPYESKGQASGIIIADNGQELLILTERKVISGAQDIYVTFADETLARATMKKYDGNTGITVLAVSRSEIGADTLEKIAVATLGNSLLMAQGDIVLAVGSPLGTTYSILTGSITSTTNEISTIDHNYTVFTTDIIGSSNGSGAIINTNGEVIGLVMQDYSSEGDQGTLTALSISELKGMIEKLSNNQDMPYIGLELTTVTNDIAREYDIPKGAYIKEVVMDSPAMTAGLQSGDVITQINGESVYNVDTFENKLLTLTPGETVKVVVKRQGTEEYTDVTCNVEVSVLQ
jgi:serine protease Do